MPVPKKRSSTTRTAMRRAHKYLTRTFAISCSNCGAPVLRHRACGACGFYRGKQVIAARAETSAS